MLLLSAFRYDQDVRVLVRMVGVTEEASNARTLLRSLCLQMCHIFGNSPEEVPSVNNLVFTNKKHSENADTSTSVTFGLGV